MAGKLILCASPIGNLADASPRLREALEEASVVYAEDSRRSRVLLEALGVTRPLRSYFAGNEAERAGELRRRLDAGETVALLTDAGMPAIADPGLSAVRAALEAGAEVTVVPGPSALTAALALSGLPSERFVFEGFLPRKGASRQRRLAALSGEERTIVLFSPPSRLGQDLEDLAAVLGPERPLVVTREITKAFEEVWRGNLQQAVAHWREVEPRGELTLVVHGGPPEEPSLEEGVVEVESLVESGAPTAEAVRMVAREMGLRRRRLYEAVIDERE
ncbi:MAG: 16S rRNA (cytidine(1402)-2'-O)-methyltransferase [Actinomycetota bacterium]|nr:16S rRNA (cytidine(1402)-2'-O)-methyltransferase [Actinomycetota bacterium]